MSLKRKGAKEKKKKLIQEGREEEVRGQFVGATRRVAPAIKRRMLYSLPLHPLE
jgi:hypothetical protein